MVNLRVKEANGRKYYYLEHTIREGNSFRNKRKYLGSEVPKDIELIKEGFMHEVFLEIGAPREADVLRLAGDEAGYLPFRRG